MTCSVKRLKDLATMSHATIMAQSKGRQTGKRRSFCANIAKAKQPKN